MSGILNLSLPLWEPTDDIIIHRTKHTVIPYSRGKKPSLYPPTKMIINANKLYDEVKLSFFGEKPRKIRRFTDEKKAIRAFIGIEETEASIANQLFSVRNQTDRDRPQLRKDIFESEFRLKESRAGQRSYRNRASSNKWNKVPLTQKTMTKTEKKVRPKTLMEKMDFYQENSEMAKRRIQTSHCPWNRHIDFQLPKTPENEKNYRLKKSEAKIKLAPIDSMREFEEGEVKEVGEMRGNVEMKRKKESKSSFAERGKSTMKFWRKEIKDHAIGLLFETTDTTSSSLIKRYFI